MQLPEFAAALRAGGYKQQSIYLYTEGAQRFLRWCTDHEREPDAAALAEFEPQARTGVDTRRTITGARYWIAWQAGDPPVSHGHGPAKRPGVASTKLRYPVYTASGVALAPPIRGAHSCETCPHGAACRRAVFEQDALALCESVLEDEIIPQPQGEI